MKKVIVVCSLFCVLNGAVEAGTTHRKPLLTLPKKLIIPEKSITKPDSLKQEKVSRDQLQFDQNIQVNPEFLAENEMAFHKVSKRTPNKDD